MINNKEREFIKYRIDRYRQWFNVNMSKYNATGNPGFYEQAIISQAKAECLESLLISLDMAKFEMGGRPV